jgi:hypothetical protein
MRLAQPAALPVLLPDSVIAVDVVGAGVGERSW